MKAEPSLTRKFFVLLTSTDDGSLVNIYCLNNRMSAAWTPGSAPTPSAMTKCCCNYEDVLSLQLAFPSFEGMSSPEFKTCSRKQNSLTRKYQGPEAT
jgi:hypothetical protein